MRDKQFAELMAFHVSVVWWIANVNSKYSVGVLLTISNWIRKIFEKLSRLDSYLCSCINVFEFVVVSNSYRVYEINQSQYK